MKKLKGSEQQVFGCDLSLQIRCLEQMRYKYLSKYFTLVKFHNFSCLLELNY